MQEQYYSNVTIITSQAEAKYGNVTESMSANVDRSLQIALGDVIQQAFANLTITGIANQQAFLRYVGILYKNINANILVNFDNAAIINI